MNDIHVCASYRGYTITYNESQELWVILELNLSTPSIKHLKTTVDTWFKEHVVPIENTPVTALTGGRPSDVVLIGYIDHPDLPSYISARIKAVVLKGGNPKKRHFPHVALVSDILIPNSVSNKGHMDSWRRETAQMHEHSTNASRSLTPMPRMKDSDIQFLKRLKADRDQNTGAPDSS